MSLDGYTPYSTFSKILNTNLDTFSVVFKKGNSKLLHNLVYIEGYDNVKKELILNHMYVNNPDSLRKGDQILSGKRLANICFRSGKIQIAFHESILKIVKNVKQISLFAIKNNSFKCDQVLPINGKEYYSLVVTYNGYRSHILQLAEEKKAAIAANK